jgi:serine/threonine-protein kinase
MGDDDELFEKRVTLLALARTLVPAATIRGSMALAATLDAPPSSPQPLPHISIDLQAELAGRERAKSPDLAIVKTIGEGGMGRVHLARQHSLDREVAVKTLKDDASPAAIAGLLREARLTGSLEHPGVIPVHALGVDAGGGPLLVMKRVEGVDWATLLTDGAHPLWALLTANSDRLTANLAILTQVCRTVEFAHSRGVIHRDIKPENVMVGGYGEVYLVDWGIATPTKAPLTRDGIAGTPAYMAPEMFLGGTLDERTDVYLLGATLHEVLTARCRHEGKDVMEVLRAAMVSKPVLYDGSVPELLATLCNAATARDPGRRPKDVRAFRDEIAEFLQRRSAMALSDAAAERLARLNALLGAAENGGAPTDLAAAYRLATESRFGFNESLREHPGNPVANAGLRSSVIALVELELRQQHADTAEALLRELDPPDAVLAGRVAALRALDEAHHREALRLEALDRDFDPSVQALPRALVVGVFVVLAAVVSAMVLGSAAVVTPWQVAIYGGVFTILTAIATLVFRKRLFTNAYNRRLIGLMLATAVLVVGQRIVNAMHDVAVEQTFASNLWLAATVCVAAAVAVQARLWLAVPPVLIGAVLTPILPARATVIFSVSIVVSLMLTGLALWSRSAGPNRPPGP